MSKTIQVPPRTVSHLGHSFDVSLHMIPGFLWEEYKQPFEEHGFGYFGTNQVQFMTSLVVDLLLDPSYFEGTRFPVPHHIGWVISDGDIDNGRWIFGNVPYTSVQNTVDQLDEMGYDAIVLQVCNPGRSDVVTRNTPIIYAKGDLVPVFNQYVPKAEKAFYLPSA